MKNYFKTAFILILSVASSMAQIAYSAEGSPPDFSSINSEKILWNKKITPYIGNKFVANFIYKGKLIDQLGDVFTMDGETQSLGGDTYLLTGFRYQEASSQGAIILDRQSHIFLVAMGVIKFDSSHHRHPEVDVFIRDRENLKFLSAIKKWAGDQPEYYKDYQLNIFDLNCKFKDLMQCKIK